MRRAAACWLLALVPVVQAGTIRPLTDVVTGATSLGDLDDAGAYVYAVSASNPLGTNPAHRPQIFRWATATGAVEQVTFFAEGVEPGRMPLNVDVELPCLAPSVSDDGAWLAFASRGNLTGSNPDGSEELFLLASDGSQLRQLTSTSDLRASIPCFRLSGNGSRVAFLHDGDLAGGNPGRVHQPFVVDADGTGLRQLAATSDGAYYGIDISDDGSRVVFDDADSLVIRAVLADGSGLRVLSSTLGVRPEISGDGSTVAMTAVFGYAQPTGNECRDGGISQVATVPWSGGVAQNVSAACGCCCAVPPPATAWMPTLSDDGSRVYYTSDAWQGNCSFDLYRASSRWPLSRQVLTSKGAVDPEPPPCRFSRASGDGSRIALLCEDGAPFGAVNADHGRELYVAYGDGSTQRQLSSGRTGGARGIAISGDGAFAAFASDAGPAGEPESPESRIYRIRADGTDLRSVAAVASRAARVWGITDDGATIVFSGDRLFAVEADGTGLRELAPVNDGVDLAGSGSLVAYRNGGSRLVGLDGTGDRLVDASGSTIRIEGSGTWVAYTDGWNVYRRRADLSAPRETLRSFAPPATLDGALIDIAAGGAIVAYVADDDPFGSNPDRNPEIFLWEAATGGHRQLTNTSRGRMEALALTEDGSAIHLLTNAPYLGLTGRKLVRIDTVTGSVELLDGVQPCSVRAFAAAADGSRIAFTGGRACAGGNVDGNLEVFLADLRADGVLRVDGTGMRWEALTGAATYDVVRGDLAALAIAGNATVDLGALSCVENDSPDLAATDPEIPAPGAGFFYLVRGGAGSYGTGSAGGERVPSAGGCGP